MLAKRTLICQNSGLKRLTVSTWPRFSLIMTLCSQEFNFTSLWWKKGILILTKDNRWLYQSQIDFKMGKPWNWFDCSLRSRQKTIPLLYRKNILKLKLYVCWKPSNIQVTNEKLDVFQTWSKYNSIRPNIWRFVDRWMS